jgi:hypothetical protein
MKKINYTALLLASLAAGVTFIILEFLVENLLARPYGISDMGYLENLKNEALGVPNQGLNLIIFILLIILVMSVYVAIRPRFKSDIKAALMTSAFFLTFIILFVTNFANLGVFSWKFCLVAIAFNLVELPPTIIIGAFSYTARTENREKN